MKTYIAYQGCSVVFSVPHYEVPSDYEHVYIIRETGRTLRVRLGKHKGVVRGVGAGHSTRGSELDREDNWTRRGIKEALRTRDFDMNLDNGL